MRNVTDIPERELTNVLCKRGEAKAALERDWVVADHYRHILLATLSAGVEGASLAEANRQSRMHPEYIAHVTEMGRIKAELIMARSRYDAISFEIRMRLSKQYEDNQGIRAGSIDT